MPKFVVKEFMARHMVTFTPDMEVLDAVHELVEHRIGGAPVVDDKGNLVGMLSEKDCLWVALNASYHGEWGGRVSEYMTTEVRTVEAEASLMDVGKLFLKESFRRYPVVDNNRLVGQISRWDLLRAMENYLTTARPG